MFFEREGIGQARRSESGDITVEWGRLDAPFDLSPMFRGLPDDMCQCRHHGYVVKGRLTFVTKAGRVHIEAGDAFDIGPGHILAPEPGCEWVLFSATDEQRRTDEAIRRNAASAAAGR
jgi:hypothetical protein